MKFRKAGKAGVSVELGLEETRFAVTQAPLAAFKLKKILLPVDFSECSTKALQYAIPFAKQFGAELVLLHVTEPYLQWSEVGPIESPDAHDVREQMEALKQTVDDSIAVKTLVQTGHAAREIVTSATELNIDLIVISTHGYTGSTRLLLGSIAEQVVRRAPCPVLVVRLREHEFIAATDSL